jgi:hypothetical protein
MARCGTCGALMTIQGCAFCGNKASLETQQRDIGFRERLAEREALSKSIKAGGGSEGFSLASLLRLCVGKTIGINVPDPGKAEGALLRGVFEDFITLERGGIEYHIPIAQIIRVTTQANAAGSGVAWNAAFPALVQVFDLIIYKGATGIGFSVPVGGGLFGDN